MTALHSPVLIIGGNSAIGRHLVDLLPGARAVARIAPPGDTRVRAIGCYTALAPQDFEGSVAVINCAGIVSGDAAALDAVNVRLQHRLAAAARDAGVRRFIAIGSFSIFGHRDLIDATTPPAPEDPYGVSKLAAERALESLQSDRFKAVTVALPAIVGTTRTGKVEQMMRWWQRIGIWPMPVSDVTRSMISADAAARTLAAASASDHVGRLLAADPIAFRYRRVAAWLRADIGGRFGLAPLAPSLLRPLRLGRSRLYRSLMTDSWLADQDNFAVRTGVETSLRATLSAMLARRHEQ